MVAEVEVVAAAEEVAAAVEVEVAVVDLVVATKVVAAVGEAVVVAEAVVTGTREVAVATGVAAVETNLGVVIMVLGKTKTRPRGVVARVVVVADITVVEVEEVVTGAMITLEVDTNKDMVVAQLETISTLEAGQLHMVKLFLKNFLQ